MSEFDKEAEREKLRQQLEEEEEDRQATQHMSDLLLKGATMTNKHCDECGDPVFRYDGQEFCPTCGREVGAATDAQAGGETGGATPDETSGADQNAGAVNQANQAAGARRPDAADGADTDRQADPGADERSSAGVPAQASTAAGNSAATSGSVTTGSAGAGGDLGGARAALVRKLAALAAEAEATDDVARSRDLLSAAREAAEALAAVDEVRD